MLQSLTIVDPVAPSVEDDTYEFLLGVSPNALCIVDKSRQIISRIVDGNNTQGWLLSAPNQDTFLDAIHIIKTTILNGGNAFHLLGLNYY